MPVLGTVNRAACHMLLNSNAIWCSEIQGIRARGDRRDPCRLHFGGYKIV